MPAFQHQTRIMMLTVLLCYSRCIRMNAHTRTHAYIFIFILVYKYKYKYAQHCTLMQTELLMFESREKKTYHDLTVSREK